MRRGPDRPVPNPFVCPRFARDYAFRAPGIVLYQVTVYTIGHSTHALTGLLELLGEHGVTRLADVRRAPRSRRTPQFNTDTLALELPAAGIDYVHLPELGGWRSPRTGSAENAGWRNRSFRAYADHMGSDEFAAGLERLSELAAERPTAAMCAEAPWWRCHRRLIADALCARGSEVCHIGADGRLARHELTDFAVVGEEGRVRYPAGGGE
jgi:uncharacterized protein (DUF488 family)